MSKVLVRWSGTTSKPAAAAALKSARFTQGKVKNKWKTFHMAGRARIMLFGRAFYKLLFKGGYSTSNI